VPQSRDIHLSTRGARTRPLFLADTNAAQYLPHFVKIQIGKHDARNA